VLLGLTLALGGCGSSPEPCLRNSDCASNEYCSAGACLLLPTDSEGGVSGADGAAGSTTVMTPDVSTVVTMTPDASGTAADEGSEADAALEADVEAGPE
jgi:hypothetical protein